MPVLTLYSEYSRQDVHDIFSPDTRFTPGAGTWGLHGIVEIPDNPGDFVFFVTFGQQQAGHTFDEWITEEGVISWQSQPGQSFLDRRIQQFIHHDDYKNLIYLFLRTQRSGNFIYLGKLRYLAHDPKREKPVYMFWQLLDWPIPANVLGRINLRLRSASMYRQGVPQLMKPLAENDEAESTFYWRGMTWQVNRQALISQVRDWIIRGLPEEAIRYKTWYVEVDGQRVSPKWLFHLITGAGYNEFDAPLAREKISQIGFQAVFINDIVANGNSNVDANDLFSLISKKRKLAFESLAESLKNEFPPHFHLDDICIKKNVTSLELHFENFKGFYAFTFSNSVVDFGVYFPGRSQKAKFVVDQLNLQTKELSRQLGYSVNASANSWQPLGRLGFVIHLVEENISQPGMSPEFEKNVSSSQVQFVKIIIQFVELTFELVKNVIDQEVQTYSNHDKRSFDQSSIPVQILETKISTVKQVLAGIIPTPSDEVICDWVHFCYEFGLYKEAKMLFTFVAPDQVNPWYYDRTKKLARLCSMKAVAKD